MHSKVTTSRATRLLSCASILAIASAGSSALAQDDEILVTGSRIPSTNAIATSPVTTIGNVEFDIRGTTRVEDLVNTLPQAFAAQGANTSNGATGTAQVSLRGLGANRTLVLVDGRRLQYGSAISSAPDLNQIPSALIERVDVLTGGASAVYGSDAVAGVVNFIMIKDFEGVRIDGQLSGYQHNNNNELAQSVLATRGFAPPEDGVFDGKGQEVTLIIGANTEDGRGNVTAYAGYRNNDAILQADRDYSACAFNGGVITPANPNGFGCGGSATTPNGTFATPTGTFTLDETGPGNTFRPSDVFINPLSADAFNFAPTNFYQRPDERYVLGAFAHYEVNEHLDIYSQAMFYDYTSDAQIAFSGTFFEATSINCDNPLLSAQQASIICGGDAGMPVSHTVYIGKRLVEGLPRNDHIRLTSFRIVGGVRGEVFEGWNYDAFFQYANTHNAQQYQNDVSITNMNRALDVIDVGGVPTCRSVVDGSDPNCVPLNLWTIGGVTPAAVAYVSVPSFQDGDTFQYMGQATLTGDLGQYGFKSPWAEEGIGIAGGFEWRKDQLDYNPDALFQSGDLAGQGGTTPAVFGSIETTDFFVEAEIPLVSGMAFAEFLKFNGGYRHSDVSTSGGYSTWKLQGDWQVTPDIRVRGGWQRAARAANVIESFTPQQTGLTTLPTLPNGQSDPCAGPTPFATLAQCMNTGVTAAQYGSIASSPAQQYNAIFGGNPNLRPEVSDTYTVGVVLTPEFVPGNLLLSVDYFDITVEDYIGIITPNTAITNCLATGDPAFCDLIQRDGAGTLWLQQSGRFLATNTNTGSLSTSGIDVNANYSFDLSEVGLGDAGGLSFDLVGTYLISYDIQELPLGPIVACEGTYGGTCASLATGGASPQWRHKLRTTWEMPIGVDMSVSWRMFTSVDQFGVANPNPSVNRNHTLSGRHYIDLAASYNVTETWNLRVGVNNLLDKDPPLTTQTAGFANGNTYPQTYDAQGRYLFIGTTIDF
jgi:outer membrane receptor protein involved in Fe transport